MPQKALLLNGLHLTTPVALLSGSSYLTYQKYFPKSIEALLKYDDYVRITDNDNQFAAMFHENKSEVGKLKKEGLNSNTTETEAITKIKEWCTEEGWNKPWELFSNLKNFCAYKPKTLYGLFRGENKHGQFITDEEDYKILFVLYKDKNEHLSLIPDASSSDSNDVGKGKVKSFCEEKLKTSREKYFEEGSKEKINKELSTWCTKPDYKTVEGKLKKHDANWKVIDDEESKTAFDRWKYTSSVITAINKSNGSESSLSADTNKEQGGPKMKSWCEKGMNKKLSDDGVYKEEYILLKSACKKTNE